MDVIETVEAMADSARAAARAGERVALVPTMGYLHEGHLSLMRLAKEQADRVVVSLFVNPTQFGPNEDFSRYPRDMERDIACCRAEGVDVLFAPSAEDMYARGHSTYVDEEEVGHQLEGQYRPGHFRGVLTVVAKLFLMVQPEVAVFGQKDAQQLWLIRKMVKDLNFPVRIIAGPTQREPDGLAMSSRNAYLTPEQRQQATCLFLALQGAARLYQEGERNVYMLRKAMMDLVEAQPDTQMDYIEIVDSETFAPLTTALRPCVALLAVWLGKTRLIDNIVLTDAGTA
jgi:pantoate--beta-alanine ligase